MCYTECNQLQLHGDLSPERGNQGMVTITCQSQRAIGTINHGKDRYRIRLLAEQFDFLCHDIWIDVALARTNRIVSGARNVDARGRAITINPGHRSSGILYLAGWRNKL